MKATIVIAALAASASGAVIDARQLRPTSRPVTTPGGTPDGTDSPITKRDPQNWPPPQFSIGRPTQSVTFFPNDPPDLSKCGLDAFQFAQVGDRDEDGYGDDQLDDYDADDCHHDIVSAQCSKHFFSTSNFHAEAANVNTKAAHVNTEATNVYPQSPLVYTSSAAIHLSTATFHSRPSFIQPVRTSDTPAPTLLTIKRSPTTTPAPLGCGVVGYTKDKVAYYFDSSGTKNTWKVCGDACKADSKCKSFGYGEANCMLFDVTAAENTNLNPMSPYTFYDAACPEELPVRRRRNDNDNEAKEEKRQIAITIALPGGPPALSSACSCLITSGPADATRTTTTTSGVKVTKTETVTRTVSMLPEDRA
ncbi:hypothetical protein BS50DRAFT_681328 [Corynespora cassiicola Philippines]|uniref:Apple domain-containing protein n=1 Tax=Corynespora cassiicola Philippines TaxID=1448308 RepID=A0A2T2N5T0_CORCC|nr:hypothetical protein BS50DRAFT_681328 [Corynespora cassiicola Philippines]